MHVWHNMGGIDIIEYLEGVFYGVKMLTTKKEWIWVATMMSPEDVRDYIDWCDEECDKIIWNEWLCKHGEEKWL